MVQIFRRCFRANFRNSGSRAIVPSSFMISQSTPMGRKPASCARSTAASVWPARCSTPPGRARNGKTWPGWTKSSGTAVGDGHDLNGPGAVGGADAGGDAARGVHAHLKIGAETLAVLAHHAVNAELLQPLGGRRHANQAAPEPGHEIDGGGRDVLRRHDEIALVLAVGIVHDDDHFAPADVGDDGFDAVESFFHSAKTSVIPESPNASRKTLPLWPD